MTMTTYDDSFDVDDFDAVELPLDCDDRPDTVEWNITYEGLPTIKCTGSVNERIAAFVEYQRRDRGGDGEVVSFVFNPNVH